VLSVQNQQPIGTNKITPKRPPKLERIEPRKPPAPIANSIY